MIERAHLLTPLVADAGHSLGHQVGAVGQRRHRAEGAVVKRLLLAMFLLAGCSKPPPSKPTEEPKQEATPVKDMVERVDLQRAIRNMFPEHQEALAVHEDQRVQITQSKRVDVGTFTSKSGKTTLPIQLYSYVALYPLEQMKLCGLIAVRPSPDLGPDTYMYIKSGKAMSANDDDACNPLDPEIPVRAAREWFADLGNFARAIAKEGWDFPSLRDRIPPTEAEKAAQKAKDDKAAAAKEAKVAAAAARASKRHNVAARDDQ